MTITSCEGWRDTPSKKQKDSDKRRREFGVSTFGIFDNAISIYLEHTDHVDHHRWTKANDTMRAFCITGCFAIELAIKNFLVAERLAEPKDCKDCGHNIYKLMNMLEDKCEDVYLSIESYVEHNKKQISRTRNMKFERMVCNFLVDFGDDSVRYGQNSYHKHDASVVLLFLKAIDTSGIMKAVRDRNKKPDKPQDREYITINKLKIPKED